MNLPADMPGPIYRRFFLAAIAITLTAGVGWGVWLLWQIGTAGAFTGASVHTINAHGHAQIFGWVGLFIMGFAYQMFPRFCATPLAAQRLAAVVFVAMVAGIAVRVTAMAMHHAPWAPAVALAAGAIELAAICTFVGQLVATRLKSTAPLHINMLFIFTAMAFFIAQAVFSLWHSWRLMTAESRDALLWQLATYQAVLRDWQIHGMALFMILGMSMHIMPRGFGLPPMSSRRAVTVWALLLIAVLGETVTFLAFRWTGIHAIAAGLLVFWLLLAVASLLPPWTWRLWRPMPAPGNRDRSAKFVRAAFAWLTLSMAMLLLMPVYQFATGIPFSHAYYGAIRHAITVGFISMMIVGVAAKVVAVLTGRVPQSLPPLWGPFLLLNLGCALRVVMQTLTDTVPGVFPFIAVSGMIELTALAWWAAHLARLMLTPPGPITHFQPLPAAPATA